MKEHTIPLRRSLRSDGPRASAGIDKAALAARAGAPDYGQRDGRESLQERPKTDASYNTGPLYTKAGATAERPLSRTPPRGLQDGKAAGPRRKSIPREDALRPDRAVPTKGTTALLDAAVDETLDDAIFNANNPPAPTKDDAPTREALEKEHVVKMAEPTPDTPGVDPNVAIPKSAEDAAQLPGLVVNGANDPSHKPSVVHLPPQEAQEEGMKEREDQRHAAREERSVDTAAARLALEVPAQHERQAQADAASSPGSTVGPLSATTSAHHHETSADTSPDNEAHHYDNGVAEEKVIPETPPELAPSQKEVREKDAHDRILKSQMDVAREHILGSSPTAADTQLLEEQAAAASVPGKEAGARPAKSEVDGRQPEVRELAGAPETANELMDDEKDDQDEVVGVPTPDEKVPEPAPGAVEAPKEETVPAPVEEAEPMDVDVPEPAPAKEEEVEQAAPAPEPMDVTEPAKPAPAKPEEPKEPSSERTTATPVSTPSIERMTTRVASGAMRHKSVSEILGETPRPNAMNTPERTPGRALAEADSNLPSGTSTPRSASSRMKSLTERAREKERSKLSTVVFAKQPVTKDTKTSALVSATAKPQGTEYPDYFMPLINAQSYSTIRGYQTLEALLASAHKTITTTNAALPFQEAQAQKIIRRIHSLQNHDKWSLRQPKRSPEPIRPTTHWDELLKEARWMRTDFREERKWKTALARRAAYECALWVNGDQEQRDVLMRKVVVLESVEEGDETMADAGEVEATAEANADVGDAEAPADVNVDTDAEVSHPTPDLVPSSDNDTPLDEFDDEPRISLLETVAPTAIFSLDNEDLVFGLSRSAASDKLLQELPMYGAPLKVHQSDLPTSEVDPDASWRKPYLPLSKYIEGKIRFTDEPPPRKKSRYEYAEESDDEDEVVFGERTQRKPQEPLQVDVALFNPENKHIRDRIHAGHQFRPPSEFPMPLQSFFENRHPSQWTWAEDDELKQLVREYQYNWSLISSMLTSKGVYYTAAERRTPWECFERWIHLEGLPADMQKTHYFRAYNSRLEAAQRSLLLQIQAQAAQPPPAVGSAPVRQIRRSTTSVRVERRRNQKHLTLVDSMRKVAKKRETTAQKQQQAQSLANMRKSNDAPVQPINKHTPAQFSKIKHDREQAILEQKARLLQQQEAHRRVR